MSYSKKDELNPMDMSSSSLSADMSLLDELFPSLGSGESSASHFTNQLALLLNTLGSSDDEGTEGTNLFSPLKLSPPRLNEIHALATANLISQTQEAIMQEYNITDLSLEKASPSENETLLDSKGAIQDDIFTNSNGIGRSENSILESCIHNTSANHCGICDKHKLDLDPNKICCQEDSHFIGSQLDSQIIDSQVNNQIIDSQVNSQVVDSQVNNQIIDSQVNNQIIDSQVNNQIIDSQPAFEHEQLIGSTVTIGDSSIDGCCLTSVKLKMLDENTSISNLKENDSSVFHLQNDGYSEKDILENMSAVESILPKPLQTDSSINNKEVLDAIVLHTPELHGRNGNNISDTCRVLDFDKETFCELNPPQSLLTHTLAGNSKVHSNSHTEIGTVGSEVRYNCEVLNSMLPPKKRHLACYTVSAKLSDTNTYDEHGERDAVENSLENGTKPNYMSGDKDRITERSLQRGILFVCVKCLKQFSTVEDLELHSTNHQQYSCPYSGCVRTFTYRSQLSYHRQTHEGEKNFQCTECGKLFSKAQHLDVHMVTHGKGKLFSCKVCGKSFTTIGNLKNHSRIHSGERPYACDINGCTKSFAELSSLKKHKVTHTGEKSYRCDICGKCFTQASSRSYHMKKHRDKL